MLLAELLLQSRLLRGGQLGQVQAGNFRIDGGRIAKFNLR